MTYLFVVNHDFCDRSGQTRHSSSQNAFCIHKEINNDMFFITRIIIFLTNYSIVLCQIMKADLK